MRRFLNQNKRIGVLVLLLYSCSYTPLKYAKPSIFQTEESIQKWKPVFSKTMYHCNVNGKILFKKFHLSGLLLLKKMDDSSTRIIFQNEMGICFFDFSWNKNNEFQVISIMKQMNKPALILTLQKDFEMILMNKASIFKNEMQFTQNQQLFHQIMLEKGYLVYTTNLKNKELSKIENFGKSKIVTIQLSTSPQNTVSEKIFITHKKAHFTIALKKINENE